MLTWGVIDVEITSASIAAFLSLANQNHIELNAIHYIDDLRITAKINVIQYRKLKTLAEKRGDSVKQIRKHGLFFTSAGILKRPVCVIGFIVWLFLVLYLPTRVLFVYVEGNQSVDSVKIVDAAAKCGIHFGASRRYVRSETVKNKLLSEIDDLQWAGVNTRGCVAIISVKERVVQQEKSLGYAINSIVASQDGVISSFTATKGNPVCRVGQAVRKGQVLVSGYTDCGICVKAGRAEAEVFALTNHSLTAVALSSGTKRVSKKDSFVGYSIQIGNNIVKLYNNSGILDASCVKMYSVKHLTLPSGFVLPVALITETWNTYDCETAFATEQGEYTRLKQLAEAYLQGSMNSGRIIHEKLSGEMTDGAYCLQGIYTCEEMIGQVRVEEILDHNGEGHR